MPSHRQLRRFVSLLAVLGLLATGCAFGEPDEEEAGAPPRFPTPSTTPSTPQGEVVAEVIASNLEVPWGLDFLPDGSALVTERDSRRILRITPDQEVETVQVIEEAYADGEGGLLGIAVSPQYETDRTVFIYYTTREDNRIARLRLGEPPEPIVTGLPSGSIHNGGRLAFGPDGYLYATTGETGSPALAQDVDNLGGKILRMTTDGEPAPGNPFPNSLVYSYGHRNVQGIAWDEQGRLYATEFGEVSWDEINLITPGGNYGWPEVEGQGSDPDFINPLVVWPTAESSCSGAAIISEILVVACLRGERLYLAQLNGQGGIMGAPVPALIDEFGRLRTVVRAPDNTVWLTTSNRDGRGEPAPEDDRILRLVIDGAGGVDRS